MRQKRKNMAKNNFDKLDREAVISNCIWLNSHYGVKSPHFWHYPAKSLDYSVDPGMYKPICPRFFNLFDEIYSSLIHIVFYSSYNVKYNKHLPL
jgi:hypothetical protein